MIVIGKNNKLRPKMEKQKWPNKKEDWDYFQLSNTRMEQSFLRTYYFSRAFADSWNLSFVSCWTLVQNLLKKGFWILFEDFITKQILEVVQDWWVLTAISSLFKVMTDKAPKMQDALRNFSFQYRGPNSMNTCWLTFWIKMQKVRLVFCTCFLAHGQHTVMRHW